MDDASNDPLLKAADQTARDELATVETELGLAETAKQLADKVLGEAKARVGQATAKMETTKAERDAKITVAKQAVAALDAASTDATLKTEDKKARAELEAAEKNFETAEREKIGAETAKTSAEAAIQKFIKKESDAKILWDQKLAATAKAANEPNTRGNSTLEELETAEKAKMLAERAEKEYELEAREAIKKEQDKKKQIEIDQAIFERENATLLKLKEETDDAEEARKKDQDEAKKAKQEYEDAKEAARKELKAMEEEANKRRKALEEESIGKNTRSGLTSTPRSSAVIERRITTVDKLINR